MLEGDDAVGGRVLLHAHLERALVRHRAAGGQKGVRELALPTGQRDELLGELVRDRARLQVAVLGGVLEAADELRLEDLRVAVPEEVHADAGDEIPLHGAIRELGEGAVARAAAEVGIEERAASRLARRLHGVIVGGHQCVVRRTDVGDGRGLLTDLRDDGVDVRGDGRALPNGLSDGVRCGVRHAADTTSAPSRPQ